MEPIISISSQPMPTIHQKMFSGLWQKVSLLCVPSFQKQAFHTNIIKPHTSFVCQLGSYSSREVTRQCVVEADRDFQRRGGGPTEASLTPPEHTLWKAMG